MQPEIRKMLVRGMFGEREFHIPLWFIVYLQFKLDSTSETDIVHFNGTRMIDQNGNVELLIPIQASYGHRDT